MTDAKPVQVAGSTGSNTVNGSNRNTSTHNTANVNTAVSERAVQSVQLNSSESQLAGPQGAARVILFDYDSFAIRPEYQSALDAHAKFLSTNKARRLAIDGHTDERGGREYNLALGQKRAEAVRRALGLLGVAEAQIEAVSFGKEKPADADMTEAAFAKNRRAELGYR